MMTGRSPGKRLAVVGQSLHVRCVQPVDPLRRSPAGAAAEQQRIEAVVDRVLHHRSIKNVIGVAGTVEQLPQFRGPLVRISH